MAEAVRRKTREPRLEIASDLTLDSTAATQTFGIMARKGAGKTYLASKLVEQLASIDCPQVVIDPVGNWWGLTVAADGHGAGLSFVVLGGEKGDVELPPEGGAAVADLVIEKNLNVVLDVSSFSKGEMRRFVADFCEQLFDHSKNRRQARMVVFEEAQRFAPQQFKGQERMLGAVEDIVRLGRNYGLGCMLISQRPQSVNKEVLSQVECLFVGQINEAHARKALLAWIVERDEDVKKRLDELAALERGEFFCWSPSWLRTFQRIRVLPKATFDASSTPTIGEASSNVGPPVGRLSAADKAALRAAMKGTGVVVPGDEDDLLLHHEQLARRAAEARADGLQNEADRRARNAEIAREALLLMLADVENLKRNLHDVILPGLAGIALTLSDGEAARPKREVPPAAPAPEPEAGGGPTPGGPLGKCAKAILTVLVQQGKPLAKPRLALMAGYSANSGGFNNALSELRTKGWIDGRGALEATPDGKQALGPVPRLPVGRQLFDYWVRHPRLDKCARAILTALRESRRASKADLGTATGYSVNSGGFNNSLSRLRTLGLIEGRGVVELATDLR